LLFFDKSPFAAKAALPSFSKRVLIVNIMKIFYRVFLILIFFTQNSFASQSRNLTVFAEQNMVVALTKITRLYSQRANVIISTNFNSSLDLINDIDSGEPADVFISAHSGLIENLRQKGLVDVYNIGYIAADQLVLVTSKSNQKVIPELLTGKLSLEESLKILDKNKTTLILDDEGSSSGKFSNDLIAGFSFADLKLFNKLNEDKSPILSSIKDNPEDYALLLASQIKNRNDLQILSTKKDSNIFYQGLVIAGDNMEVAREFVKFLKSNAAKSILQQSGFTAE
jgi:molybdate transport system substrate-binding protein